MSTEQELQTIKKSLIGVIDEMSHILENAPEKMNEMAQKLTRINELALQITMVTGISKADEEFLQKAAQNLEKQIQPFINANSELKQSQKLNTVNELKTFKEQVQNLKPTPRMGG